MPTLVFLGTGSSYGVPSPGCDCTVCRKGSRPLAKWYRLRSSVLIRNRGKNLLVDCSPDFREQALRNRVQKVDACLVSHGHADAAMGIQDLRAHSLKRKIPVFCSRETQKNLRRIFFYIFAKNKGPNARHISDLELKGFPKRFLWQGLKIRPVPVFHPPMASNTEQAVDPCHKPERCNPTANFQPNSTEL